MNKVNSLITEPIPQLIRKIGVPVGIGVLFNTLFQVVDTFWAGSVSNEALAALTLSFPIFFIIIGLASGMATGTSALIGNALGAERPEEAEHIAVQGLLLTVALSLLTMGLGLSSAPFLFRVLGAEGDYLSISLSYIRPIFRGAIFFNLVYMWNATLTAQGNTKPFRNLLMFGFLLNIILDPWFIFGGGGLPPLGVAGVAYATVLIQAAGVCYLGYKALNSPLFTVDWWRQLVPNPAIFSQIIRQGLPNALDLSTISVGGFIITYFISQFGTNSVAAYGIASRISQLVWLPLVGLDVATLSLVAQNNGAERYDRVWRTFNTAIRYGLMLMFGIGVVVLSLSEPLVSFFTDDPEIIAIGVRYIWISAVALPAIPFSFIGFAALRGIKRPMLPMVMSMARMIVLPAIIMYFLLTYWGVGLDGIWWTTTMIAILTGAVAWVAVIKLLPRAKPSTALNVGGRSKGLD